MTLPPESPITCAGAIPSASISPAVSATSSAEEYGGAPASKVVERPASRLSWRTTNLPPEASRSQKPSDHDSIELPAP